METTTKTAALTRKERDANRLVYTSGLTQLGLEFYGGFIFSMNSIFLTDVALFSPAFAAAVDVGRTIFRAIISPFIGIAMDKSIFEKGRKYGLWINLSGFLLALTYGIMYYIPTFAVPGETWVKVAIVVLSVIAAITNQVTYVASGAFFPAITKDPTKRALASSARTFGKELGKGISGALYPLMLASFAISTGSEAMAYFWIAVIFSFGLFIANWFAAKDVDKVCSPSEEDRQKPREKIPLSQMLKQMVTNKPMLILTLVAVFVIMRNMLAGGMTPYYYKYVAQSMTQFALYNTVTRVCALSAIVLTPLLVKFVGTKQTGIIGALGTGISQMLLWLFNDGTSFIILSGSANVFINIFTCVIVTLFARTADYGHWKYGIKSDGVNMAVYQMSIQLAIICSSIVRGWLLTSVGFEANAPVTPELASGIINCMAFVGVISCIGAILLLFVDLGDKRMQQIEEEMAQREALPNA